MVELRSIVAIHLVPAEERFSPLLQAQLGASQQVCGRGAESKAFGLHWNYFLNLCSSAQYLAKLCGLHANT